MTFYLCMTGIHTRLTSEQGKEESPEAACTSKAVFEVWEVGMERCEAGETSVIISDGKVIFNVHTSNTVYSCKGGVSQVRRV